MRVKLFGNAHHAAVLGVLHQTQHFHHDGLFHLGAGYAPGEDLVLMARIFRVGSIAFRFSRHFLMPSSLLATAKQTKTLERADAYLLAIDLFLLQDGA